MHGTCMLQRMTHPFGLAITDAPSEGRCGEPASPLHDVSHIMAGITHTIIFISGDSAPALPGLDLILLPGLALHTRPQGYFRQEGGAHWKGSLYVFDGRMAISPGHTSESHETHDRQYPAAHTPRIHILRSASRAV